MPEAQKKERPQYITLPKRALVVATVDQLLIPERRLEIRGLSGGISDIPHVTVQPADPRNYLFHPEDAKIITSEPPYYVNGEQFDEFKKRFGLDKVNDCFFVVFEKHETDGFLTKKLMDVSAVVTNDDFFNSIAVSSLAINRTRAIAQRIFTGEARGYTNYYTLLVGPTVYNVTGPKEAEDLMEEIRLDAETVTLAHALVAGNIEKYLTTYKGIETGNQSAGMTKITGPFFHDAMALLARRYSFPIKDYGILLRTNEISLKLLQEKQMQFFLKHNSI